MFLMILDKINSFRIQRMARFVDFTKGF